VGLALLLCDATLKEYFHEGRKEFALKVHLQWQCGFGNLALRRTFKESSTSGQNFLL
jgi:hypothetical protein